MTGALDSFHFFMLYPTIVGAGISAVLILTKGKHGRFSFDTHEGAQKFHTNPTPRIGGIAIFIAVVTAWLITGYETKWLLGRMIVAGLPAFAAGLREDFTKQVSVRQRLLSTMISGLLASVLTDYQIDHLDIAGLDLIVAFVPVSIAFTAFAVAGMANAINIIDGFNGLASGILMICFALFGLIGWQVSDMTVVELCMLLIFSIAGFMLFNFPFGKIFMGDGGAYFMGFMLAWMAVMLPMRNPQVSPWVSVVVCAYPVVETLFSIIRRFWNSAHTAQADSEHLHSLIKLNIIMPRFTVMPQYFRNAMVSPLCWLLSIMMSILALVFYNNTTMLILSFLGSYAFYLIVYYIVAIAFKPSAPNSIHKRQNREMERNHDQHTISIKHQG